MWFHMCRYLQWWNPAENETSVTILPLQAALLRERGMEEEISEHSSNILSTTKKTFCQRRKTEHMLLKCISSHHFSTLTLHRDKKDLYLQRSWSLEHKFTSRLLGASSSLISSRLQISGTQRPMKTLTARASMRFFSSTQPSHSKEVPISWIQPSKYNFRFQASSQYLNPEPTEATQPKNRKPPKTVPDLWRLVTVFGLWDQSFCSKLL